MNDKSQKPGRVSLRKITPVSVDCLSLDHDNPRLVNARCADDARIVGQLYSGEQLDELLHSIAANGYLDIEPLVVVAENKDLIVLEGNRRLAAVRLFREPALADRVREAVGIRVNVPEISDANRESLDRVSVYRVAKRDEARSFIGFKHINGVAKWNSYAKAKFAAKWYRDSDTSIDRIAESIGDKHDTIKRMVNAIYVLEQAENSGCFALSDRMTERFNFSHLYAALSRAPYMTHLGLETAWARYDPEPDPVPNDKLDALKEILRWIYGSREDGVKPVIQSQNPDIKKLAEVLASPEGLVVLRAGESLENAHVCTQPVGQRLVEALVHARSHLQEALKDLRGFDGRDRFPIDIAEDIHLTDQIIHEHMKKKRNEPVSEDAE